MTDEMYKYNPLGTDKRDRICRFAIAKVVGGENYLSAADGGESYLSAVQAVSSPGKWIPVFGQDRAEYCYEDGTFFRRSNGRHIYILTWLRPDSSPESGFWRYSHFNPEF